jgi:hypothetical protein
MKISKIWYFLLFLILVTFLARSAYLWRDFVFVYDQGRDALEVQKILSGNLTLIGPTTGLFGVFLGPFHYYFLTLLYAVGGGNPIVPAYAFVLLSSLTIVPIFAFAKKIGGTLAGVLASIFFSFSFVQWQFSRWLSNPTNLPLVSLIMFLCAIKALETKKARWFLAVGLLLGVCMQLEAANAIFMIPTLVVVLITEYLLAGKHAQVLMRLWDDKVLILSSALGFILTLIPQGLFELIHDFPITNSLVKSFQTTHGVGLLENLPKRVELLFDLYARGWFFSSPWRHLALAILGISTILVGWLSKQKLLRNQAFRVLMIWFLVPLFFHLGYTGNYGNFWDYYIIGQYAPLYILIASVLVVGLKKRGLSMLVSLVVLILTLLGVVVPNSAEWFKLSIPYNERISLSLQLDAVDWVVKEAGGEPFGMWAYTPSAQDDVYKYLFSYRSRYNGISPVEHPENTKRMFLLVEDDPNNPARRERWIKEMSSIGKVINTEKFGAVTVFAVERK